MREIPLHLQRRFEQRWAARFPSLRAAPISPIALKELSLPNLAVEVEHIGAAQLPTGRKSRRRVETSATALILAGQEDPGLSKP
jgi:hypothetical protein